MNLSPEKKIAGVLVPLFALRREDDLGIGDLGALAGDEDEGNEHEWRTEAKSHGEPPAAQDELA